MNQNGQNAAIQVMALAGMLAMTAVLQLAPDTAAARVAHAVRQGLRVIIDEAV